MSRTRPVREQALTNREFPIVAPAGESSLTKETSESSLPGAFPETPLKEPDSFGVSPLPATSGDSNPVNVSAGEKLPPQSDVTANTIQSNVTTSKEDYQKAGQEPESLSVNPIPASVGAGNPVDVPAGEKIPEAGQVTSSTIDSTATTSKEDYEKAGSSIPFIGGALAAIGIGTAGGAALSSNKEENLIPESSLPMGADAGKALDAGPTITSAAPISTTAELAGKVPLEERKEAIVDDVRATTETVPEVVKESIAEADVAPEATTSAEAVKEKAEVEQELLKKIPSTDGAGEPAPAIAAATSETAPAATTETPSSPTGPAGTLGTSSSAAAAVADGTEAAEAPTSLPHTTAPPEKTEGDNTEYAPPHASGSAPGVSPAAAAALSDGTEDPTLLDEPAVQYLKQNDAAAAETPAAAAETKTAEPETKASEAPAPAAPSTTEAPKEAPKTEAPAAAAAAPQTKETPAAASSATETPKKAAATTPTTSPATGSASKEKKKKHRISSLFKKIFD